MHWLTLRCLGAVAAGVLVTAALAALLSSYYAANPEPALKSAALRPLPFPKNEKMLNDLSARLQQESAALANIAPAAGDARSRANK